MKRTTLENVKLSGDLNNDGCVDILDLVKVASSFGTKEGDDKYSPIADINKDKVVDIFDLTAVVNSFGQGTCPSGGVLPPQPVAPPKQEPIPQGGCSCVNKCGGGDVTGNCVNTKYPNKCYCDNACTNLGDCCPDKKAVCG